MVPDHATLIENVGTHFIAEASWYDLAAKDRYNKPGLTSSGEKFDPDSLDRISSPNLPNGTKVLLWSRDSRLAVYAIVNNTGPFMGDRVIDVPVGLARAMGFEELGVASLSIVIVAPPLPDEVRYRKNRKYKFEGGPMGRFEDLEDAIAVLPFSPEMKQLKETEPKLLSFGHKLRPRIFAGNKHRPTRVSVAGKTLGDMQPKWQTSLFDDR